MSQPNGQQKAGMDVLDAKYTQHALTVSAITQNFSQLQNLFEKKYYCIAV
jgi:hypothetical protein